MIAMDIRDNLRAYIKNNGLLQYHIAAKAGLTPSQLSAVLNKKRDLEANEMLNICMVLNISPGELRQYAPVEPEQKGA